MRRYFWSKGCGGQYPVDAVMGLESGRVSPGALQLCCTMGVIQDFAQGADDLRTFSGLRVSQERLRQITESQGREAARVRESGVLKPAWSAAEATAGFGEPTRIYVGADGVMVRIVTQEEKDKRRQEQVIRRQQRGRAGVGNTSPLPKPRPGSDDRFKEMKIGLFYDQSKTRVHAFATAGDHEAFGILLRRHADAIALEQALETLSLTDGGPWIRNQILKHLQKLNAIPSRLRTRLLDFYHLSEHVWDTAKACPEPRTGLPGATARRPVPGSGSSFTTSNTSGVFRCWPPSRRRRRSFAPRLSKMPCVCCGITSWNDGRWWSTRRRWPRAGTSAPVRPRPCARTSLCGSSVRA